MTGAPTNDEGTSSTRVTEPQRFSGTARRPAEALPTRASPQSRGSSPPVVERITLRIDGVERARVERLDPFELELAEGTRVRVEIGDKLWIAPATSRRGRWKTFADDPDLAGLADRAPGPHVQVELRRERIDEGARVEILAEHVEHAFEEGGGHRSAPTRKLARITARAIAGGEEPGLEMDRVVADLAANDIPKDKRKRARRNARPLPSRAGWIGGGAAAAAFGAAALVPFSPLTVDLVVLGMAASTLTLTLWGLRHTPRFSVDDKHIEDVMTNPRLRAATIAAVPMAMIWGPPFVADLGAALRSAPASARAVNASLGSCIALIVFSVLMLVVVLMTSRRSTRLLRVLLAAPPLPAGPIRTWGSFEGTVRDPTPVTAEGEMAAVVHLVHETVTEGSDPNIYVERVLSKGTFHVDRMGTSFEIRPEGACWGSAVSVRVQGKDARRRTEKHVVPIGGSILIAGNAVRDPGAKSGSFTATGPESLLFFAAGRGKSARAAARRLLWVRRGVIAAAIMSGIGGAALAWWVEPQLPPFYMPDTD